MSTFGRFRLWTSFETSPVSVNNRPELTTDRPQHLIVTTDKPNKDVAVTSIRYTIHFLRITFILRLAGMELIYIYFINQGFVQFPKDA